MIIGIGEAEGEPPVIVFGLLRRELRRLRRGGLVQLTAVEAEAMGLPPLGIIIHSGKSEAAIKAAIESL